MSDEPLQSLGDDATSARSARRPGPSAVSLGDERTAGGGAGGTDTLVAGLEIVDLEARYTIERPLGQGGMGAVLLATDRRLGRKVAIKRILGTAAGSRIAVARFLTEARAIAAVSHPNIVQIYDYGRAKDGPFLIMEYVDGGSLLDRCGSSAIPLGEALELACRLCDGLAKAHDGGIVHRDIKPANILLASDGAPKLTDFGLAKAEAVSHGHTITGMGAVMGTPDFMPPEQRRDAAEVDHRSDLWSLAATVYQMVTGRSPRIIRFSDVPPALQGVLGKALEDRKDSRYQSAREFRDALETVGAAAGRGGRSAAADNAVEEGRCPACGTLNPDKSRKFCRNPRCGASLRMACLQCDAQMPAWEAICGECGANQPRKLAEKRAAFEAARATAEERLAEHAFDAAAALADDLAAISLPQLSDLAGWGRQFVERIAQERKRQEDFAAEKLREARAHGDAFDYPACILALEAIPQRLRTTAAAELLATFQKRHAEATRLIDTIAARIGRREIDGLVPLVERAVSLRGDRKDLAKLRDQLAQRLGRRLVAARTALAAGDAATARQALAGAAIEDLGEEAALLDRVTRAAAAEERLLALVKEAKADGTVSVAEAREIVQAGEECLADNPASETAKLLVGQAREILERHARRLRQAEARRTSELERQKREEELRREAVARQRAEILGRPPFRNSVGMQLKLLPAGAYTMGQAGYETPQRVSIVKPFFIGVHQVTNAQWKRVLGGSVPSTWVADDHPVVNVSWGDAMRFCRMLSSLPEEGLAGREYRLPWEGEWEYACRAGTTTMYSFGDERLKLGEYAWFEGNAGKTTHPVGQLKPNAWGLYDMHGNVWEWCGDWAPREGEEESGRMCRGGSWTDAVENCRSACRPDEEPPSSRFDNVGFRIALNPFEAEPPEAAVEGKTSGTDGGESTDE